MPEPVCLEGRARRRLLQVLVQRRASLSPREALPAEKERASPPGKPMAAPPPLSTAESVGSPKGSADVIDAGFPTRSEDAEARGPSGRGLLLGAAIALALLGASYAGMAYSHPILTLANPPDGALALWKTPPLSLSPLFVSLRASKWSLLASLLCESTFLLFCAVLCIVFMHFAVAWVPSRNARVRWDALSMLALLLATGAALAGLLLLPFLFIGTPGSDFLRAHLFVWSLSRYLLLFLVLLCGCACVFLGSTLLGAAWRI